MVYGKVAVCRGKGPMALVNRGWSCTIQRRRTKGWRTDVATASAARQARQQARMLAR